MCNPPQCEDIYVMSPDGTNPVRLTHGGGARPSAAYNSGGADWSHSRKLIAFQSNRVDRVPQIHLMNLDGTEQQLLVSLPGGAAFPSFSQSGNELCFHGFASPRDIYIVNVHGTGLTNLTSAPTGCPNSPDSRLERPEHPLRLVSKRECDRIHKYPDGNQEIYVIDAVNRSPQTHDCRGQRHQPGILAKGRPHRVREQSRRHARDLRDEGGRDWRRREADQLQRRTDAEQRHRQQADLVTCGDRIAFHRRVGAQGARGHLEVYTINADGTNATQITFTPSPGFSGFPSWGKWSADSIGQ